MKKKDMSEIAQLKIDLRNYKSMYLNQKNRVNTLKEENNNLKELLKNQELEIKYLKQEKETNKQTIEEYKRMIFHKKTNNKWCCELNCNWKCNNNWDNNSEKKERETNSYQKKIPNENEITDIFEYKIKKCFECWNDLVNIEKYTKYIEDIDATFVSGKANKTIIKEIIWSWYCNKCRKFRSPKPISKIQVVYWENLRMFINFQITIAKMEYSITQKFLEMVYGIQISSWEIRNILERESLILTPEYERIRERITTQLWVHFDETWWVVQQDPESNYAWLMTWTETRDALFELWLSRWWWAVKMLAQNAKENEEERKRSMKMDEQITSFVWITDWYCWYTNKFEIHWLCWAHPNRKLRDLKDSKSLEEDKLERCLITYEEFNKLYSKVRDEIEKEKNRIEKWKASTKEEREKLKDKLMLELLKISKIHKNDPKKLITYKESLSKYAEKYFVCILIPWIPADNNKAERWLRHLVLKRKTSHWSITSESAKFMSINYSVLLSLYWKSHAHFFEKYKRIRDASLIWIDIED